MITTATATRQPSGKWLFTWPVSLPPYAVWLDGIELSKGLTEESFEYDGVDYPDKAPPIEIIETGEVAENKTNPPVAVIQWRGLSGAIAYEVEQEIASVFVVQVSAMERGLGYYSWTSEALADVTLHKFKVLAIDAAGNEGVAIPFEMTIVRNPPPPAVDIAVSGGDIVVSAS